MIRVHDLEDGWLVEITGVRPEVGTAPTTTARVGSRTGPGQDPIPHAALAALDAVDTVDTAFLDTRAMAWFDVWHRRGATAGRCENAATDGVL